METNPVRTATEADEIPIIDTIVLAFAADPVARWIYPEPRQYLASMPSFARVFGEGAFSHNGAHCTEGYAGAALWLPPNVHPDEEALGEVMESTVSASTRGELIAVFEQMEEYQRVGWRSYLHPPSSPVEPP